jgi:hypothetical protein
MEERCRSGVATDLNLGNLIEVEIVSTRQLLRAALSNRPGDAARLVCPDSLWDSRTLSPRLTSAFVVPAAARAGTDRPLRRGQAAMPTQRGSGLTSR